MKAASAPGDPVAPTEEAEHPLKRQTEAFLGFGWSSSFFNLTLHLLEMPQKVVCRYSKDSSFLDVHSQAASGTYRLYMLQ